MTISEMDSTEFYLINFTKFRDILICWISFRNFTSTVKDQGP